MSFSMRMSSGSFVVLLITQETVRMHVNEIESRRDGFIFYRFRVFLFPGED